MSGAASGPKRQESQGDVIRETIESLVIALVLAFVFRAYVAEAFVIPTGSMAPTLLGRHLVVDCPQCGYHFTVDLPGNEGTTLDRSFPAVCPMCHFPSHLKRGRSSSNGDRILVLKYIYSLVEPQRWDVVVFKNPALPDQNYIKRLVGLPGEEILLIEGNVYVRGDGEGDWDIARKPEKVQRAIWQPIYDSRYVPLDGGTEGAGRDYYPWRRPWEPTLGAWEFADDRGYHHSSAEPAALQFDYDHAMKGGAGLFPYNQAPLGQPMYERIEDVRLATMVLPHEHGLAVELSTQARLDAEDAYAPPFEVIARVGADGLMQLLARDEQGTTRELAQAQGAPLPAGRATELELWYADQTVSLWRQGEEVLRWEYDLAISLVIARRRPQPFPALAIRVDGAPASLYQVRVDRDLYYMSRSIGGGDDRPLARGGIYKDDRGQVGEPLQLEADQFFCLGDNSPKSLDGRFWDDADPWIERLVFDPEAENILGVVPRSLMIGRAFFVYFPAPLRWREDGMIVAPNFGEMRMIH